jgi:hypothetical protein
MNELIAAAKGSGGRGAAYARLKRRWTDAVVLLARSARIAPLERAQFAWRWVERDRRRDPDNVAAGGRKLVLDGLVAAKVLPGDGWANVAGWRDEFEVGPRPGVEVTITPCPTPSAPSSKDWLPR